MMVKFISNLNQDTLPHTADVVIVGGGPAGAAALWAINRMAPGTRLVLIEKSGQLAAGSSMAALECFRTCWPALCLAKQMQRSVEVFKNADEYLGESAAESIQLKQHGYLFCAFTERQASVLKADVERLHEIGLSHIEYLDADEVYYRFGWLGRAVIAAKYDSVAGWLDSNGLVYKYVQSASSAQVLLGVQDAQIGVEGGHVTGVRTPHGVIAAASVVIAAGANAASVARTAGVSLPVLLRPRQSFTTRWRHAEFPQDAPLIIGATPYPHVRPEAQSGAIFGWEYAWNRKHAGAEYGTNEAHDAILAPVNSIESLKDMRFPSITLMLLAQQFGHAEGEGFGDPRYLSSIRHNVGYYVHRDGAAAYRTSEDGTRRPYESERAIIDAVPGVDGLFVSVAHAGHGIMTSPAAGEILASKVLGRALPDPSFDEFGMDVPWVEYDEAIL